LPRVAVRRPGRRAGPSRLGGSTQPAGGSNRRGGHQWHRRPGHEWRLHCHRRLQRDRAGPWPRRRLDSMVGVRASGGTSCGRLRDHGRSGEWDCGHRGDAGGSPATGGEQAPRLLAGKSGGATASGATPRPVDQRTTGGSIATGGTSATGGASGGSTTGGGSGAVGDAASFHVSTGLTGRTTSSRGASASGLSSASDTYSTVLAKCECDPAGFEDSTQC